MSPRRCPVPTGESVDWICQPQELHDQGSFLQTLPSVHLGEAGNLPSKYIGISTRKYLREEKQNPRWPWGLEEPVVQLQSPAVGTAPLLLNNCSGSSLPSAPPTSHAQPPCPFLDSPLWPPALLNSLTLLLIQLSDTLPAPGPQCRSEFLPLLCSCLQ